MPSARSWAVTRQTTNEPELSREQRPHPGEGLPKATHNKRMVSMPWEPAGQEGKYSGKGT